MSLENYRIYRVKVDSGRELTSRDLNPSLVKDYNKLLTGMIIIKGEALTAIHVGSGKSSIEDIRCKEKVKYGGKPVIPGSTLKGLCRSRLQLLSVAVSGRVSFTLDPSSPPPANPPIKGMQGWRHFTIWSPATWEVRDKTGYAIDDDVFGAAGLASRVFFGNLVMEDGGQDMFNLDFNEKLEVITEGSKFRGDVSFIGLRSEELGLIVIGLRLHENKPVLVGRSKYRKRRRGAVSVTLGRLLLTPVEFRFRDYCENALKGLNVSYVKEGDMLVIRDAIGFARKLADIAFKEFPELRRDFDEVEALEKLG
ncbi:MAG: hypothetical protein DRJ32_03380 [Thermoprotei archaeon]|nr:MAG: hypothetical protein DRJ32_03380 [Thermoprotei archaeon]